MVCLANSSVEGSNYLKTKENLNINAPFFVKTMIHGNISDSHCPFRNVLLVILLFYYLFLYCCGCESYSQGLVSVLASMREHFWSSGKSSYQYLVGWRAVLLCKKSLGISPLLHNSL